MRGILIIVFLICSFVSIAQPGGYTAGTFVNWSFNSRDHGFFKSNRFDAVHDSLRRVVIHAEGDGQTSITGLTTEAPGKYLNDAGTNWDGKVVRANGDTIQFMVLTLFNNFGGYNPPSIVSDINYFFSNATNLPDTSKHNRYAFSGFSGGPGRMWGTMVESGFVYANVFGHTLSISPTGIGVDVTAISANKRNKVHRNGDDANVGTPEVAANDLFNDLSGYKDLYKPAATGQGHSADSALSIYGVGTAALTDSSKSWWRLIAEWVQPAPVVYPYPAASASPQITISRSKIFDLNGVQYKSAWGLFDGDTLTRMNLNGIDMDAFVIPFSSFIVLDSNYTKLQVKYFDGGGSGTTLTLNFYDANKTLVGTKTLTTESYLTWITDNNIDTTISVRFVEVAASTISNFNSGIYELKLYGVAGSAAASIYSGTTITPIADLGKWAHGANVIDDKLETYQIGSPSTKLLDKVAKSLRVNYETMRWDYIPDGYDGELAAQPLWLGRFGIDHIKTRVVDQVTAGRFKASLTWAASQGSIKHLNSTQGHDTLNNYVFFGSQPENKYMDAVGADSTDPNSWDGAAELIYKLVSFYGSNASANISGITVKGGTSTRGQNGFRVFEIGNEITFDNQPRWHSPKVYYTMMKKIYDRAKIADPNCKIYLGATTYMHNDYWKGLYFYHYWTYGVGATIPFDGICMNLYLNNDYDGQGTSGSAYAIPPENWKLRERLIALKAQFDNMFPNRPVRWTESGFNTTDASPWGVPVISGKTRDQTSGDWLLRSKAIAQTVRLIEEHDIYSFNNLGGYSFDSMALVRDTFVLGAYLGSRLYEKGYAAANMVTVEADGGYNWFSTVIANGDSTGVWCTKLDHSSDATKKLYKVWKGTQSNSTTSSYVVNVGGTATSATLYTTNYSSFSPTSSSLSITSGNVTVPTVSEKMQWIEVTYSGGSSPIPTGLPRQRGKRIKWVTN